MTNAFAKLTKKFEKKINKGKNAFIILQTLEDSMLLGLNQEVSLNTLLIHQKNNGRSLIQGFINKTPINDAAPVNIFLDLEDIELPNVYFYKDEHVEQLSDSTDDFIVIFCEFIPYSILFYVFNTPYSQIGKKSLSSMNIPLTEYFKQLFLDTLPNDKRQIIQEALYREYTDQVKE